MASPRYPLERLAEVRADAAEQETLELARALADEGAAEAAVAQAEAVVAALRSRLTDASRVDDPVPAWRLRQHDAYRGRLVRDLDAARARHRAAAATLVRCQAATATARDRTAAARAERDAVDRHRSDWDDRQRKARDRADE
ncbi:MAG: hypothetical protein R3B06_01630 [Kofleriaceae bacterium]